MSELRPCALIPVYNHPDPVAGVVERLARHELPIILVDDGSDAGCRRELERLASLGHTLVTHADNRGKGAAVRAGALEARGRFVLFSDVDLSTPIEEEARLREVLKKGAISRSLLDFAHIGRPLHEWSSQ